MSKKATLKKAACFLLAFAMVFALVPVAAFAYVPIQEMGVGVGNPTIIRTEAELRAMSTRVGAHYQLGNDIHLTGQWTPIGTNSVPFAGILDGNGFAIHGLNVNETTVLAGLFGRTDGAHLHDIRIVSGSVHSTGAYVGGLVGRASRTTITDSYVGIPVTGRRLVGGIVGRANNTIIERSYTTGRIESTVPSGTNNANTGGIAGMIENGSAIRNSFSTGDIHALHSRVGGIAGRTDASSIVNSFSTGPISGRGTMGGIVGTRNAASVIENNAAMTPHITIAGTGSTFGRVARDGTFHFNRAYSGMQLLNRAGDNRVIPAAANIGERTRGGLCTPRDAFRSDRIFRDMGWDFDYVWMINPNVYPYHNYPVLRRGRACCCDTPGTVRLEVNPFISVLRDVGDWTELTVVSTDPSYTPSNLWWTSNPNYMNYLRIEEIGVGEGRFRVEVINTRLDDSLNITLTFQSVRGVGTALVVVLGEEEIEPFDIAVSVGDTFQLGRWLGNYLQPAAGWSSSNLASVAVSPTGVVTALGVGTSTVSTVGFEIYVRVLSDSRPTGIYIDEPEDGRILDMGETMELTAIITPADSRQVPIIWSSSNPNVVMIPDDFDPMAGEVTIHGVGVGSATITATIIGPDNMPRVASIEIVVGILPYRVVIVTQCGYDSYEISYHEMTLGTAETFSTRLYPSNATEGVTWRIEDEHENSHPALAHLVVNNTYNTANITPLGIGTISLFAEVDGQDIGEELEINIVGQPLVRHVLADWRTIGYTGSTRIYAIDRDRNRSEAFIEGTGGVNGIQLHAAGTTNIIQAVGWNSSLPPFGLRAWQAVIPNVAGYSNFRVSFQQRANQFSPRDFTLQYSFNGSDWVTVSDEFTDFPVWVGGGFTNEYFITFVADIPTNAGTANTLYLRWVAGSVNTMGNPIVGNPMSFIQNVYVSGEK